MQSQIQFEKPKNNINSNDVIQTITNKLRKGDAIFLLNGENQITIYHSCVSPNE